jgi:transposase-like protein
MYVDGMGFRQIGRHLQVDHVSVMNWVKAYAAELPDAPVPEEADKIEMDELYTFIGEKKTGSTS